MNIHFRNGERVETGKYRRQFEAGEKGPTSKGTETPRQREGKVYSGGKALRRASQALYNRVNGSQGKINGPTKWGNINGLTKPGSMRGK